MSTGRASQRSARRATLAPGLATVGGATGSGGVRESSGSISPRHTLRMKALREREKSNESSAHSDVGGSAKASKPASKLASRGSSRSQQVQFAFGSRVMKPKAGMAAAETRGVPRMVAASGPVVADPGALARTRRDRSGSRHESQEPRPSVRGAYGGQQALSHRPARQDSKPETPNLKSKEAERETVGASSKSKLEGETRTGEGHDGVTGADSNAHGSARSSSTPSEAKDTMNTARTTLSEVDEAALRVVEDEARRDTEEIIAAVESQAAAVLARTAETQVSVDEIIRRLKARQ